KICASPAHYLPDRPIRVLELGAGTGLLSIITARLARSSSTIVATDYHPDVLANLAQNIKTNELVNVSVQHLDWENPWQSDEPFDVILGADVIYHPDHALWIRNCVEKLLSKHGTFWLIIPIRSIGRHEDLDHTVETVFGENILSKEDIERQEKIG